MRSRRRPDGGDGGGGEGETFSRAPMPEASPAQQAAIAMVAIRLRNHPVGGWCCRRSAGPTAVRSERSLMPQGGRLAFRVANVEEF